MENEEKYVGILTTYVDDALTRDDYEEFCDINNMEYDDDEYSFDEWKREEAEQTWEDDMDNLEYIMAEEEFAITGSVGRWDGRRTIMPVHIQGLRNAIQRCISDCYLDIEVKLNVETGKVEFYGHHHDATDCFEICRLNKNGIKWFNAKEERDETNIEPNEKWFKKINRREIWG